MIFLRVMITKHTVLRNNFMKLNILVHNCLHRFTIRECIYTCIIYPRGTSNLLKKAMKIFRIEPFRRGIVFTNRKCLCKGETPRISTNSINRLTNYILGIDRAIKTILDTCNCKVFGGKGVAAIFHTWYIQSS